MEPNYLVSEIKRTGMSHSSWRRAGFKTTLKMLPYWAWKYRTSTEALQSLVQASKWIWPHWIPYLLAFTQEQKVSWNQGDAWSFVKSRKMCMACIVALGPWDIATINHCHQLLSAKNCNIRLLGFPGSTGPLKRLIKHNFYSLRLVRLS